MSEQASGQTNFLGPIKSKGNTLRLARWADFGGIDNIHAPDEMAFGKMVKGRNVYVNDQGKLVNRPGKTLRLSGNIHSLFPYGNNMFAVKSDNLVSIDRDYNVSILRAVGPGRMSYTVIGDRVAFSNEVQIGYIKDLVAYDFPDVTNETKVKVFPAKILRTYKGRMYLARGNVLWFTDAAKYGVVDMRKGFYLFPEEITMVEPVNDGIFVSSDKTYFLDGDSPEKFKQGTVDEDKAVYGTSCVFEGIRIGTEISGKIAMWLSTSGICIGMPGGFMNTGKKVVNLLENTYKVPACNEGAGFLNTTLGAVYTTTLRR